MRHCQCFVGIALLVGCSTTAAPDCAVEPPDAAPSPRPGVDPRCRELQPEEVPRDTELERLYPVRLTLLDGVAIADVQGLASYGDVPAGMLRLRVSLADGVVALTDRVSVGNSIVGIRPDLLCAIDEERDLEVRLVVAGHENPSSADFYLLSRPILRVTRHSTGEPIFTFGEELYRGENGSIPRTLPHARVWLAPELAEDASCCPDTRCNVDVCGALEPVIAGCRWVDVTSEDDGFCYARQVR